METCKSCGSTSATGGRFCHNCGVELESRAEKVIVTNQYIWALSILPLFFGIATATLNLVIPMGTNQFWLWLTWFLVSSLLVFADIRRLRTSGFFVSYGPWALLLPAYLYRRAQVTKSPQTWLLVWMASLVLSIAIQAVGLLTFGQTIQGSALEEEVKSWILNNELATDASLTVTCPEVVSAKQGNSYVCEVEIPDYGSLYYQIEFNDALGNFSIQLAN